MGDGPTESAGDGDGDGDGDGQADGQGDGDGDGDGDTGTKFDLEPFGDQAPPAVSCKVMDDMDAIGTCDNVAPPNSFEPEIQWTFEGLGENTQSTMTPLVVNLTDDNDDGEIDLCDIPDVIVVGAKSFGGDGPVYALNGQTGELEWESVATMSSWVNAALGDIDNDGLPEIVGVKQNRFVALEHDGTTKWVSEPMPLSHGLGGVGIADFDNDGTPEIYFGPNIYDNEGNVMLDTGLDLNTIHNFLTVAADIDDDGDLELVLGDRAYHHDGPLAYMNDLGPGIPHVADFDEDGEPEVLHTGPNGLGLTEVDGTVIYSGLTPNGVPAQGFTWARPASVHDMDGDGVSEYAMSSATIYSVYEGNADMVWQAPVDDGSGGATGTAFDFLAARGESPRAA